MTAKRMGAWAVLAGLMLATSPARAQPAAWDARPWLEDLAVVRGAIETKYANLEWQLIERELDLAGLFQRADAALRVAGSDVQAIAVFNRLIQRIDDGHVSISWPRPTPPPVMPVSDGPRTDTRENFFCRARGFEPAAPGIAARLPAAEPVGSGDLFPSVLVTVGRTRVGILRIGRFDDRAGLSPCVEAVTALGLPLDQTCGDSCAERLRTEAYRRVAAGLERRLGELRAAGASVLVVDVTRNGGGSEWAEAAARMLSRRPLLSERRGFVRGPHWAGNWARLAERLRGFAAEAAGEDRARLLAWAAEADAARAEAETLCPPTGGCPWLGRAGFATGLVGQAPAGAFAGKPWAPWVFTPAQYAYRDGVWDGPLVVLVDQDTASAAEEFAAVLQDNRAALIVGARTVGSGCGYTWGGTPTRLPNSGATLLVPDCARFRADGSNEVRGIVPDLLLGWRSNDGPALRARFLEQALPEVAARAIALHRRR